MHLPASGKPKKKASDPKKLVKLITSCALTNRIGVNMCEGYAKTELLSGVTTIRTVGGVADYDTKIRDLAAAGKILAPRVLASNMVTASCMVSGCTIWSFWNAVLTKRAGGV